MYTCAQCAVHACKQENHEKMPKNCPMRNSGLEQKALAEYAAPEIRKFHIVSSEIEAMGYCIWTRVRETMEFCRIMGFHRLGLAFCTGLSKEAKILDTVLRQNGFEVVSVICKNGGFEKKEIGIPEHLTLHPGCFEAMCNPIGQAMLLEEQKTQFNLVLGLCVGHDSLFYKYTNTLTTTIGVKDRVLAHNPMGALYCADGYLSKQLRPEQDQNRYKEDMQ